MSEERKKSTLFEGDAFVPVPDSERHAWWQTSLIWAGSSICVPTIMVGAILMQGFTFMEMLLSSIIGMGIVVFIFCMQGMQGTDTGLPTVVLARAAFGRKGADFIISFIVAGTLVCWTGSDCEIAGESFIQIFSLNDVELNRDITIIILGLIMLTVAIFGEKALARLNMVAVPALVVLCIYGVVTSLGDMQFADILKYEPIDPMRLTEGIALTAGMVAVGSTISPDYHRFCRDRKGSCLAAIVGILPYCIFLYIAGAIMGVATGESDITILVAKLGLPVIGLIILILATWTTMAADAYLGGLAFTNLLHLPGTKRAVSTAISGVLGIFLAVFGIMDYFANFLNMMAACIPPVAGVMIADYYILKKGKAANWKETPGVNWIGFICLALGVLVALFVPYGFSTINGPIVSGAAYVIVMKMLKK